MKKTVLFILMMAVILVPVHAQEAVEETLSTETTYREGVYGPNKKTPRNERRQNFREAARRKMQALHQQYPEATREEIRTMARDQYLENHPKAAERYQDLQALREENPDASRRELVDFYKEGRVEERKEDFVERVRKNHPDWSDAQVQQHVKRAVERRRENRLERGSKSWDKRQDRWDRRNDLRSRFQNYRQGQRHHRRQDFRQGNAGSRRNFDSHRGQRGRKLGGGQRLGLR